MSARTVKLEFFPDSTSDQSTLAGLALFLAGQMLTRPDGAFYARWDAEKNEAVWYYSTDHMAIFEWPQQTEPILRQTSRGTFRSVIFRLGSFAVEEQDYMPLCGFYFLEHEKNGILIRKRVMIHSDFFPEYGVWIKATFLTVPDDPIVWVSDEPLP